MNSMQKTQETIQGKESGFSISSVQSISVRLENNHEEEELLSRRDQGEAFDCQSDYPSTFLPLQTYNFQENLMENLQDQISFDLPGATNRNPEIPCQPSEEGLNRDVMKASKVFHSDYLKFFKNNRNAILQLIRHHCQSPQGTYKLILANITAKCSKRTKFRMSKIKSLVAPNTTYKPIVAEINQLFYDQFEASHSAPHYVRLVQKVRQIETQI